MPLLKRAKRLRVPSTSLIDEELDEQTRPSEQETNQTNDNPRKKVRCDGCEDSPQEDDEEESSSSSGTTEKVREMVNRFFA